MTPLRIGMIGCGGMARHHGHKWKDVGEAELVALADPSQASIDQFIAEVRPGAQIATFSDHRAMLAESKLDAVVIVSPHAHHFAQAIDALDAGCHVLVEKPMVTATDQAKALIAHAEAAHKVLSVAFLGPFTTEFQYIRNLITSGQLGEIYLVQGTCAQPWIKLFSQTWRAVQSLSGGGNLYDSGAHMFNAMLYLTGLAAEQVFAFVDNKGYDVDVVASVAIKLAGGTLGSAVVSGDATVFEQGIYIQGTKGSVKTSIYGGDMQIWLGDQRVKYPQVPETTSLHQNFVDCIHGRCDTPSPAILGLRQARLMDAIYESARTGQAVHVVAD
ncbi:MAG: Gfo/Idh/MocA family oxidoreductase [Roseiflexaceae bacterium]|nr:Gfo/Idh/MocA family oxidoreductase [Roseiflexaceae bacterium]